MGHSHLPGQCAIPPPQVKRQWRWVGTLILILLTGSAFAQPPVTTPRPAFLTDPSDAATQNQGIRVLLVPEREAMLSSSVAARIIALPVPLGGKFRSGDVLVQFDCAEQTARLGIAEAEVNSANETLLAKRKLQEYRSVSELDVRVAAAALAKAQAEASLVRAQMRNCAVIAPFSGVISKVHIRNFETIAPGQLLLDIVDNSVLRFQLHIPSHLLTSLHLGTRFKVAIDETGQTYPANVIAISGRVDPASQTIEILAAVEGIFKELIAGMSGIAKFDVR